MALVRGVRSFFSVVLVALLFVPGSAVLRLWLLPAVRLFPARRQALTSVYMRGVTRAILGLLSLGGARFRREGAIPTAEPVLIVGNHQSLLDILQTTLLARPFVPGFVTRKRYSRFVPLVSACVRLLGAPVVDPKRNPAAAIEAIRQAARELRHGLLLFPEGHRTRDGAILPFRSKGFEAVLSERRLPVYLVLHEGVWRVRRFVDLLFRVHQIDAVAEVMGPFEPPSHPEDLPTFLAELRQRLVDRLAERRRDASFNT